MGVARIVGGAVLGDIAGDVVGSAAHELRKLVYDSEDDDIDEARSNSGNPSTSSRDRAYTQHAINILKRELG